MSWVQPCIVRVRLLFPPTLSQYTRTPSALLPSRGYWRFLNPGPFNIKGELDQSIRLWVLAQYPCRAHSYCHHGINCISGRGGDGGHSRTRYGLDIHVVLLSLLTDCRHTDLFYNIRLHPAVAIFQIFASQMIGYGIAGLREYSLSYP